MKDLIFFFVLIFGGAMAEASQHYIVFHKKGEKWPKEGLSFDSPVAQDHAKYFAGLNKKGIIVQGGPFPGASGGMMVFKEGVSEEDVKKYASEDPAIKNAVLSFEIKKWMRVFSNQ